MNEYYEPKSASRKWNVNPNSSAPLLYDILPARLKGLLPTFTSTVVKPAEDSVVHFSSESIPSNTERAAVLRRTTVAACGVATQYVVMSLMMSVAD